LSVSIDLNRTWRENYGMLSSQVLWSCNCRQHS